MVRNYALRRPHASARPAAPSELSLDLLCEETINWLLGCTTCKARRMKCDETKPICQQCTRRGVSCAGYPKFLKWRPIRQVKGDVVQSSHRLDDAQSGPDHLGSNTQSLQMGPFGQFHGQLHAAVSSLFIESSAHSPDRGGPADDTAPERNFTAATPQESSLNVLIDSVFANSPQSVDFSRFLLTPGPLGPSSHFEDPFSRAEINDHGEWDVPGLEDLLGSAVVTLEDEVGSAATQTPQPHQGVKPASERSALITVLPNDSEVHQVAQQWPSPSTTPEMMRHLFEDQTCSILSIKEDQTRNPWRTLIWPLAAHSAALYHALAAMTCLHLSNIEPQLRNPGLQHFELCTQALTDENVDMPIHANIAARLGLALAQTWDYEKSSTDISHIDAAKALIRQAGSKDQISNLTVANLSRLSFLANTCLYMDVISRLTCLDPQSSNDVEFMTVWSTLSGFIPNEQQLDPLMGCAITLFPMIGRLAEVVGRVRKRPEKRNSPAIISKATELRIAIESWVPPIDSESTSESSLNLTDSIQTAEAYRWASLLLLRQTVPELPWRHSIWELASKSLVFLATIPLTSRTTIVQILPLMLAGCEAFEDDDRVWVQERWGLMSHRMVTGILDRCRDITKEVWRRRDKYEASIGLKLKSQHPAPPSDASSLARDDSTVSSAAPEPADQADGVEAKAQSDTRALDFPESAAFKKGVDPVTRAGHLHYTVRGDLHCFAVMKDWKWQVFLG